MRELQVSICGVAVIACALAMAADPSERSRLYVTPAAATLVEQGLALAAPKTVAPDSQGVPAPGVRFQPNLAQATTSPWVDSNLWRFQRGLRNPNYAKLPAGSAPLAAAEAFAFRVDAILNPDAADVAELGKLLAFLKAQDQPALPVMANIGVVDDRSPAMGEVLNMLTRRNLLYRVVAAQTHGLDLMVQLGTPEFPQASAQNPSDFASRVRDKLGDDKRLVRLYGTNTTIAHLTGDDKRARLVLLSYSRNRTQPGVRVRLLGRYKSPKLAAYGTSEDAQLTDIDNSGNATEFSVPQFSTIAIIDLDALK